MTEALSIVKAAPLQTHPSYGIGGLELYVRDHLHGRLFLVALVITPRGLTTQVSERHGDTK